MAELLVLVERYALAGQARPAGTAAPVIELAGRKPGL